MRNANIIAVYINNESVKKPLEYYDSNLSSTLTLLKVMKEYIWLDKIYGRTDIQRHC